MFASSSEKRPGLNPVTAMAQVPVLSLSVFFSIFKQAEPPHSLILSRGDADEWNPRSTTFWTYLPHQVSLIAWPGINDGNSFFFPVHATRLSTPYRC